ncbi:MAG: hypothetical protein MI976_12430 [Pseudomonadales bacterium]|nr:hypothetical protein [Pseudomonadales bacterium]
MNIHRVFDFNALIQTECDDTQMVQSVSEFFVGFILTCFKITLGGLSAGTMLLLLASTLPPHSSFVPFLSAYSGAAAILYVASLSDAKNPRDFFAMIIPSILIWGLLMAQINNGLLLGFSLFTHALTSFYGSISKPNGALQELQFWPVLLGFNGIVLSYWALNI